MGQIEGQQKIPIQQSQNSKSGETNKLKPEAIIVSMMTKTFLFFLSYKITIIQSDEFILKYIILPAEVRSVYFLPKAGKFSSKAICLLPAGGWEIIIHNDLLTSRRRLEKFSSNAI
jgi:hypothetical protein